MQLPTASSSSPVPTQSSPDGSHPLAAKIAVALCLLTFLIFLPVVTFEFIDYDDDVFVTANEKVAPGFTWEGIKWAFTSADIDYWRPVSWLSHMLDLELFGAVAGGHHLSNLLIHCAAVVMAFLALHRLTEEIWPSAMVAALFAWHPLHVESVAWIAERKDVLCGFFFFFTLWAYARHAQSRSVRWYWMALVGFGLGAASKPMIVTLPFVLLLLDFWPLNRFPLLRNAAATPSMAPRTLPRLLLEKVPFFAVVALLSLSTILSQHRVGTLSDLDRVPLLLRVQNSITAYAVYVGQTFWPKDLAILYPYALISTWKWIAAGALLITISLGCWWQRLRRSYLMVGWCWFLGVLVPVIGILQVGEQAHANRYTYLPLVGLFIMLVWLGKDWGTIGARRAIVRAVAIGSLAGLALVTRAELAHWENTVTVFQRTVDVTTGNYTALANLGAGLRNRGRIKEALQRQRESLAIFPTEVAYLNLFLCHYDLGEKELALVAANRAFRLNPNGKNATEMLEALRQSVNNPKDRAFILKVLALAYSAKGELTTAMHHLEQAIRDNPQDASLRIDLAASQAARGLDAEATVTLIEALKSSPTNSVAHSNLGALLAKAGRREAALEHYALALRHDPGNPHTRYNNALLLTRLGRATEAKAEYELVLQRDGQHLPAALQLAWLLATNEKCRDGEAALRCVEVALRATGGGTSASLLDIAAAAHAAKGNFTQAFDIATAALRAAESMQATNQLTRIRHRISVYQRREAYTQSLDEVVAP